MILRSSSSLLQCFRQPLSDNVWDRRGGLGVWCGEVDGWPRWCGWEVGEVGGGQVGRRGGCEGAVRLVACVCVGGCGRMAGRWDGRGGWFGVSWGVEVVGRWCVCGGGG